MRILSTKAGRIAFVITACFAWGGSTQARILQASYAGVGSETSVPYGWDDFCSRRPKECEVPQAAPVDLKLTDDRWETLDRINRQVNTSIKPVSNFEHWGTTLDHWDYPVDGKGDCKIYALYKRKLLLDSGFPRQALLMTIVRDLHGEGHAILTIKTDHGDFVLDNLADEIRPWDETGYHFIKRQSQRDPNVWVAVTDTGTPAATVVSDTERLQRDLLAVDAARGEIENGLQMLKSSWASLWIPWPEREVDAHIGLAAPEAGLIGVPSQTSHALATRETFNGRDASLGVEAAASGSSHGSI